MSTTPSADGYTSALLGQGLSTPEFSTVHNTEYLEGYSRGIRDLEQFKSGRLSVFDLVKNAGIEYRNHESDLHVPRTEVTDRIVQLGRMYNHMHASTFINEIDKKQWYDILFAYPHCKNFIPRTVFTPKG